MKFKVDEISSVIAEEIQQYRSEIDVAEVGKVLEVGDGIARVYGLANAMAGELVEFPERNQFGQVLNLEENSAGVVIMGDYLEIREGDEVKRTGELLSVPCGEPMVGRTVDPLGRPRFRLVGDSVVLVVVVVVVSEIAISSWTAFLLLSLSVCRCFSGRR